MQPKPFRQYRLCNADFGVVTFDEAVAEKAHQLADLAHQRGLRIGYMLVRPGLNPQPLHQIGYLLQPLVAVAAVDRDDLSTGVFEFVSESVAVASQDGTSAWFGRDPRIVPAAASLLTGPRALDRLLFDLLADSGLDYRKAAAPGGVRAAA